MPRTDSTPAPGTRPGWMTVGAVLCSITLVIVVVCDLFLPASRAVEVWLGFEVTGWLALATAPLHWLIFALGAWGFWTGQRWIVPAAAGYLFYAALAHLVWSEASAHGRGWQIGLVQAAAIATVGWMLLRLRALDAPSMKGAEQR